ncbi:hypothetical protein psyc5s11_08230 [Clostridium gelidum]|uniref:Uncharacterized protein n=1 Tax=Clostridium gelidum TaxID=704125 RepID=A0ABN6IT05_9CLOT|nr:hypothetical protein psyc5s11_08230 [Clostridium gelidum]
MSSEPKSIICCESLTQEERYASRAPIIMENRLANGLVVVFDCALYLNDSLLPLYIKQIDKISSCETIHYPIIIINEICIL